MSKVSCIVAYPSTTKEGGETTFDLKYYMDIHMEMIDRYWTKHGMKSWEVQTFPKEKSLDGSTPPYIVCTTIYWDNVNDLKAALGAPETKETSADVARFTNVYPTIWISDVVGSKL